ncbi:MAG: hypothetical protein Q9226_007470 [Calogaya cf. arnoldii]
MLNLSLAVVASFVSLCFATPLFPELRAKRKPPPAAPPGSEQLGTGLYAGVTVQDIINSSLDSHNVAPFFYNAATASSRAQDALTNGWANPGSKGASWEGVFPLPVCSVGWAASSDMERKQYILQGHDHEARPNWCGRVCTGDLGTTRAFIKAANMEGLRVRRCFVRRIRAIEVRERGMEGYVVEGG